MNTSLNTRIGAMALLGTVLIAGAALANDTHHPDQTTAAPAATPSAPPSSGGMTGMMGMMNRMMSMMGSDMATAMASDRPADHPCLDGTNAAPADPATKN